MLKNANHHLSLQQVIIILLVKCLAFMLMAADLRWWWLLKVGMAVAVSYSKTTVTHQLTLSPMISRQHAMLFDSILPIPWWSSDTTPCFHVHDPSAGPNKLHSVAKKIKINKLESVFTNPATAL